MKKIKLQLYTALILLATPCFAQKLPYIKVVEKSNLQRVDVLINDSLFTSLMYADSLKKPVLYPIIAQGGIVVTRGYPIHPVLGDQVDHPHQIGLWFNYGNVNGADYWNNSNYRDTTKTAYGKIKFNKITSYKNGTGKAELSINCTWFNPRVNAVLSENSTFTFAVSLDGMRFITRKTQLTALTDVLFKDNKEGLFAMRVSRQLEHAADKAVYVYTGNGLNKKISDKKTTTGSYQSSTGVTGEAVFGTRAPWLKLHGEIDGEAISLLMMDHPENVNYPGYWMARGYGLFAINPLGAEAYTNGKEHLNFKLGKGEQVTFKHRLIISTSLTQREADNLFNSFKQE